jgi:hypothetical protein
LRAAGDERCRREQCYRGGVRRTLALAIVVAARLARADAPLPGGDALVLDADEIAARVTIEYELAPRLAGKPTSFAPDVWFGVTRALTVGIIHSNASVSRIDRAASFCFHHHPIYGCVRTYHNAGLDARYALRGGSLAIAAHARLLLRDVDPYKPAVTLGTAALWSHGRLTLAADPYLRLGLFNTDRGNRTNLMLPLDVAVRVVARTELGLHTGYDSDIAVWRDGFHIPLGVYARAAVTSHVEVGALFGFTSALGPQDTLSRRLLWLWLGWNS